MKYILDAIKMKAVDDFTINQIGIPSMVLMERAALSVCNHIQTDINKNAKILTVCGRGNNGGDGLAVARMLKEKGYLVEVLLLGEVEHMTKETSQQLKIASELGVKVLNKVKIEAYNVIIDAIFGIGLSKEVKGIYHAVIKEINESENVVYSIDIPSGIRANDGQVMNIAVKADYTITFGYEKIGLILYPGCEYAGMLSIEDIGFPLTLPASVHANTFLYDKTDLKRLPIRYAYSNKGTYGKVLVIAGTKNMGGACYLAAKAAYCSGAGLVKVFTVEENRNMIQTLLPEALLSTYDTDSCRFEVVLEQLRADMKWADSIVIGPGIGLTDTTKKMVDLVLRQAEVPVVVDADALHILSEHNEYVKRGTGDTAYEIKLGNHIILTPHVKEMSRLAGCSTKEITENILGSVKIATRNQGYTLALKDARTIVSNGEQLYINSSGNNGMATGGSGDVLTGIIAAFTAAGMQPFKATCLGVYVHGLAGDEARIKKGVYSLVASDIIDALSMVLR